MLFLKSYKSTSIQHLSLGHKSNFYLCILFACIVVSEDSIVNSKLFVEKYYSISINRIHAFDLPSWSNDDKKKPDL